MQASKLLADTHVLFSAQTYLAWRINEHYYDGTHYVWCAPVFNASSLTIQDKFYGIPPSSSPFEIYRSFDEDTKRGDLHSFNIERTKKGLKTGASFKLSQNVIGESDYTRILEMIDSEKDIKLYEPIMYIIPKYLVESKLELIPIKDSAGLLSTEFRITNLHRSEFTTIRF